MIASLCLATALAVPAQPLPQDTAKQEPAPQEPAKQETAGPSAPVIPSPFSYTYAQIDLVRGDGEGFSDGPDGIDLHGSYALKDKLFVFGGIALLDGEVGAADIDIDTFELGLGWHTPLHPLTDFWAGASLLYSNSDSGAPGNTADAGGWGLQAGVRHNASAQFELDATLGVTDYSGVSSNTWLELGGIYHATAQLGLVGTVTTSDDFDALALGLRYQL